MQGKNSKKNDVSLKRLFIAAAISLALCLLLGFLVLFACFGPRKSGLESLEVPSFIGLCENEIGDCAGLEIRREWIYSDECERGVVISQSPYPNARRKAAKGESYPVTVYVSLGKRTERVPELAGLDPLSAAAALRMLGARVRTVAIYSDTADGEVIDSHPSEGTEIRPGDTVTLYVSRIRVSEPVTVPELCGMEYSDAIRLALSSGLFIGECDGMGIVISQSLPAGARVLYGSYISLETENAAEGEMVLPPDDR